MITGKVVFCHMTVGSARRGLQAATSTAGTASMSIEVVKVSDNDRNRKCYGKYAGDDAHGADQLAPDTNWRDVTVAHCRHGNDRPPERAWNRRKLFTRKQTHQLSKYGAVDFSIFTQVQLRD